MLGSIWDEGSLGSNPFPSLQQWKRDRSRPDPWERVRSTSVVRQPLLSQVAAPEPLWASADSASRLQRVQEAASGLGRTVGPSVFAGRTELAPGSLARAGDAAPIPAWGGWEANSAKIENALATPMPQPVAMGSGGLTTQGDIDPWQTPRAAWVAQPSPELSFGARANGAIYDVIYGPGQTPVRSFTGVGRDVPLPTEVLVEAAIARRSGQPADRLGAVSGGGGQSIRPPAAPGRYLGADMVYDQGTGQGATTIRPPAAPGRYLGADMVYDQGTGQGATPISSRNMSDGGPGTSSAKGQAAIDRKMGMKRRLLGGIETALSSADLGIGYGAQRLFDKGAAAVADDMPKLSRALTGMGRGARFLAPAAAFAAPLIPAATGALEGYGEAGVGGALIQGGTSAAGSVLGGMAAGALMGSAVPGIGTVIGAGLGAIGGSLVGKGLTNLAQGAVEKAQMGDTGPMGSIGRGLDAFIDTPFEKEQKAILQQMNSPAMQAVRMQEETRRLREESARRQMVFEQAALQGLLG